MNDEHLRSEGNSTPRSRLSNDSQRYFDFLDVSHSVFSKTHYYQDMYSVHPWSRRICSRLSGISRAALRTRSCSARLDELSRPKIKHERHVRQEYFDNITNYAYSGVKTTALTAQCSDRLAALAQPKKALNTNTFPKVVPAQASGTQISDRIYELAKPRQKLILLNSPWMNKKKS